MNETQAVRKTSISVPEMQKMLGLGKTEAYWLVKKNYFKTIVAGGRMRVLLSSFEDWYANQFSYYKVDGPLHRAALRETTLSVAEIARMLGVHRNTIYGLVKAGHFETVKMARTTLVKRDSFERWYQGQNRYKKVRQGKEGQHGVHSET